MRAIQVETHTFRPDGDLPACPAVRRLESTCLEAVSLDTQRSTP